MAGVARAFLGHEVRLLGHPRAKSGALPDLQTGQTGTLSVPFRKSACDVGSQGRLERGESGVTVDSLAAVLAPLGVSLQDLFKPFKEVVGPRTPRRRG